jgi:hypothetical protein
VTAFITRGHAFPATRFPLILLVFGFHGLTRHSPSGGVTAAQLPQSPRLGAGRKHRLGADAERLSHPAEESRTRHFHAVLDFSDIFSVSDHILSKPLQEAKLA